MDDLWASATFDIISCAFPVGDFYCRIITTTQVEDVALACRSYHLGYIFKIGSLDDNKSGELQVSRVYYCESGFANPTFEAKEAYNNLPTHLKTCLLYLSMYPEGYIISKGDLVKQWVAEGFLSGVEWEDRDKIAGGYFDELVSRGMIQPVHTDDNSDVLSCTVQHMIFDLIKCKSMEDNFIIIVSNFRTILGLVDKVRRLSVQFGDAKCANIPAGFMISQVRSLVYFGFLNCLPPIVDYKFLGVLALHLWADEDKSFDLTRIGELFRLRYLKIECNTGVELPAKIGGLQFLATLQVDATLSAVPSDIILLKKLLHLCVPSKSILPTGVGHMTSLRTLGHFDLGSNSEYNVMGLEKLTNLQHLQLTCCTVHPAENLEKNTQLLGSVLQKLIILQSVTLVPVADFSPLQDDARASSISIPCDGFTMVAPLQYLHLQRIELSRRCCVFSSLPKWLGELSKLCILKIAVRRLSTEDIGILKTIPALTALSLYIQSAPAERIVITEGGFPVLSYFKFMYAAPCLSFVQGAMPNVRKLKLCFNANRLEPNSLVVAGFLHLTGLKEITAKIGWPGANESQRRAVEYALKSAVSNYQETLIIRAQCVDVIFDGEDIKSTAAEEKEHEIDAESVLGASKSQQMAEVEILLAVKKIGTALGNEDLRQASSLLKKFQCSMARIKRELRLMHDFICQMDVRNWKNQSCECWVQELRMLVDGIEDIVDEYSYIGHLKHDMGWGTYLNKGFEQPKGMLSVNRITSLLNKAEVNLVQLLQAKDQGFSMVGGGNPGDSSYIIAKSKHLASISSSLDKEDLASVDKNREKLEQLLAGDDLECSVIVLHGMGGLGKTALAANVFRKERERFECHAWVSVSQTCSMKDVLKCLITEFYKVRNSTPGNMDHMNTAGLQVELKMLLGNKKYLIVLDDVWAPEVVNDLLGAFGQNQKRSRVIVTTRIDGIANLASEERRIRLECLPEEDSWKLFCKMVFSREINHEFPTELIKLAHQIVGKCKGIPLAIVIVGRLLFVRDKTKEEFKRICVRLDWELFNNPSMEHFKNILYLSFIYLPTYLKSCLLYCSLFPENYLFQRKKLVRLWIAEGFIEERGGSTLEEVAEDYLGELVCRNMLQLVERNSFGRMKKFRMDDLLRELAVDLCQKDCFGDIYEEDKCGGSLQMDGRRLVVHKLKKDIQQSFSSVHRLRTVITLDSSMPSFTLLSLLSNKSIYMTVLELSGVPIEKIPDAIGDLFNLRHLGLRESKVKLLPKSVEKLLNLLTLDVSRSKIGELPGEIVKLKKLRHLFVEKLNDPSGRGFQCHSGVRIPNGLGNLTNLRTLQALEAQDESVRQLEELRQLRSLRIWNVKRFYCERLCKSLVQMRFLSSLDVSASDEDEVLRLSVFPRNLQKLFLRGRLAEGALDESPLFQAVAEQNLYSLSLSWSQLREDPLPSLSRLSNLTELFFIRAYNGEQLAFLAGWFPKLKILSLRDLPNLKRLETQQGAMATLEKLYLVNLSSMTEVPAGLEFLKPLQDLAFMEITSEFFMSLRQCSTLPPCVGGILSEIELLAAAGAES